MPINSTTPYASPPNPNDPYSLCGHCHLRPCSAACAKQTNPMRRRPVDIASHFTSDELDTLMGASLYVSEPPRREAAELLARLDEATDPGHEHRIPRQGGDSRRSQIRAAPRDS